MEKAEKSVEEVDLFVLHQANRRIVEAIAKRLKQPIEKFPMDMMQNGNMSSASIPVLLDELKQAGKLQPGMKISCRRVWRRPYMGRHVFGMVSLNNKMIKGNFRNFRITYNCLGACRVSIRF